MIFVVLVLKIIYFSVNTNNLINDKYNLIFKNIEYDKEDCELGIINQYKILKTKYLPPKIDNWYLKWPAHNIEMGDKKWIQ